MPRRDADIAVIYTPPRVAPQVLDLLWMVRLTILCHPDVAARIAGADIGAFLAANDLLHVQARRPSAILPVGDLRPGRRARRVPGSIAAWSSTPPQLAVQYALSGEGLALVDTVLFQDEIAAGRLVQPFDIQVDDGYGYYLSIHPDDLDRPEIALFRSWLIRRFSRPFAIPGRAAQRSADDPLIRTVSPCVPPTLSIVALLVAVFGVLAGNGMLTILLPVRAAARRLSRRSTSA